MIIRKAMILAAGAGTRMRPITNTIPKPLVQVDHQTLLDRILDKLAAAGIEEVIVNSYYLADILEAHIHQRLEHTPAPSITISHENDVLETGGGVAQALPLLGDEPFLVINGDVLWRDGTIPTLTQIIQNWEDHLDALLLLHPTDTAKGYDGKGDFDLSSDNLLIRPEQFDHLPYVFAGISILHPRLFHDLPAPPFSLNILYWQNRTKDGTIYRFKGVEHQGEWLHIGTPEGLEMANQYFASLKTSV